MNSNARSKLTHLTKEEKTSAIDSLIAYFQRERNEQIGVIAAEDLLDHILTQIEPPLYKSGIKEAREAMKKRLEELELDLTVLES